MNFSKKIIGITVGVIVLLSLLSFSILNKQNYRCVIQLKNYSGEGAYVVVSLMNPKGEYEKTLWMMGDDEEWYEDLIKWWSFNEKKQEDIDAIAGESILGGERKMISFTINSDKLDKGYKIRFESAVEDQDYHIKDAEVIFSKENLNKKINGSGYIRYVNVVSK